MVNYCTQNVCLHKNSRLPTYLLTCTSQTQTNVCVCVSFLSYGCVFVYLRRWANYFSIAANTRTDRQIYEVVSFKITPVDIGITEAPGTLYQFVLTSFTIFPRLQTTSCCCSFPCPVPLLEKLSSCIIDEALAQVGAYNYPATQKFKCLPRPQRLLAKRPSTSCLKWAVLSY